MAHRLCRSKVFCRYSAIIDSSEIGENPSQTIEQNSFLHDGKARALLQNRAKLHLDIPSTTNKCNCNFEPSPRLSCGLNEKTMTRWSHFMLQGVERSRIIANFAT